MFTKKFSSFQKHLDRGQRNLSVPAVDEAVAPNDVHKKVFKLSKTFGPGTEKFVSTAVAPNDVPEKV